MKARKVPTLREWIEAVWEEESAKLKPLREAYQKAKDEGDEESAKRLSERIDRGRRAPDKFLRELSRVRVACELPRVLKKYANGYLDHPGFYGLAIVDAWNNRPEEERREILERIVSCEGDPYAPEYRIVEALQNKDVELLRAVADAIEFRKLDASHFRIKESLLTYSTFTRGRPHHTAEEIKLMVAKDCKVQMREFREMLRELKVPFKQAARGKASPNYGSGV